MLRIVQHHRFPRESVDPSAWDWFRLFVFLRHKMSNKVDAGNGGVSPAVSVVAIRPAVPDLFVGRLVLRHEFLEQKPQVVRSY